MQIEPGVNERDRNQPPNRDQDQNLPHRHKQRKYSGATNRVNDSFANREVQLICMAQIQRHAAQIYHGEIEGKMVLSKKTGIRFA